MKKLNTAAPFPQREENGHAPAASSTPNESHNQVILSTPAVSYTGKSRRQKKRRSLVFFLIVSLASLILSFFLFTLYLDVKLSPQLKDLGLAEAQKEIQQRINTEILSLCDAGELDCTDLLTAKINGFGEISCIEVNTEKLNRMRGTLVDRINRSLDQKQTFSLSVPAGSLTNSGILSWISFPMRVKYAPLGAVSGEIKTEFMDSGINQTRYTVYAEVEASVVLLLPGENPSTKAVVRVPLGETVVMGEVPQLYSER